jgi:iron(III) transport system substrate-binding protein
MMNNGNAKIGGTLCVLLVTALIFTTCASFADFINAGGSGNNTDTLYIYTNSANGGRGEWIYEQAAAAGFDVAFVNMGSGSLRNRLLEERDEPVADLIYGYNNMDYEQLKKQNLLLKWEPVWAKEVDMSLGDTDGFYYPVVVQPIFLIYNTTVYPPGKEPKDYTELAANPIYRGKYVISNSFTASTSRLVLLGILTRYKDPSGELGISAEGWTVMKQYFQNGYLDKDGKDPLENVLNGTRPIMQMYGSGYLSQTKEYGLTNIDVMRPAVGVPYGIEQIAIVNSTPKIDQARAFADWFGSAEVQAKFSAQFSTCPVHPEALKQSPAEVRALMGKFKPQDVDWMLASTMLDSWVEKIRNEFAR